MLALSCGINPNGMPEFEVCYSLHISIKETAPDAQCSLAINDFSSQSIEPALWVFLVQIQQISSATSVTIFSISRVHKQPLRFCHFNY
jgi:hypothetical protein